MLRDSKIIFDKDDDLKKLQEQARDFLSKDLARREMPHSLQVINKYFIEDYLNDIKDCLMEKDIVSQFYISNLLLSHLIDAFCRFHKIPLVKIYSEPACAQSFSFVSYGYQPQQRWPVHSSTIP